MCLKVVENGKHKDVHIKEGEVSLCPVCEVQCTSKTSKTNSCVSCLYYLCLCRCFYSQRVFRTPRRDRPTQWGWWWSGGGCPLRPTVWGFLQYCFTFPFLFDQQQQEKWMTKSRRDWDVHWGFQVLCGQQHHHPNWEMVSLQGSGNWAGANHQRVRCFQLHPAQHSRLNGVIQSNLPLLCLFRIMETKPFKTGRPDPSKPCVTSPKNKYILCWCNSWQCCSIISRVQFVTTIFEQTAEIAKEAPFQMNTMNVMSPYCFQAWLEKQRPSLASGGPIDMFGAQFETEVITWFPGVWLCVAWPECNLKRLQLHYFTSWCSLSSKTWTPWRAVVVRHHKPCTFTQQQQVQCAVGSPIHLQYLCTVFQRLCCHYTRRWCLDRARQTRHGARVTYGSGRWCVFQSAP